jgi:hypothetical protein
VAELATALYPFGPRRARLSVERCHQVLRGQNGVVIEFNSVPPPPGGYTQTPLPVSSTSAVVSTVSVSSGELEPMQSSAPATATLAVPVGLKPNKSSFIAAAALGLAVIAGVALALRSGAGVPASAAAGQALPQANAAAPNGAALPPALNPSVPSVTAASPAPVAAPMAAAPEAEDAAATPSAKAGKKSAKARAVARPARPVAAPPSAKPQAAKRTTLDDSEPDVGY